MSPERPVLATIRENGSTRAVEVIEGVLKLLPYRDVAEALVAGIDSFGGEEGAEPEEIRTEDADWAPPVLRPHKIVCLGHNFKSHIQEMGRPTPSYPVLFGKFARALTGPYDPIQIPPGITTLDWEAELAVVIGREARNVPEREARDAIAGFTIINDISVREFQWRTPQFLQGKIFESTVPIGPVVVPGPNVDWAQALRIDCRVNGEIVQDANTSDMIFRPEFMVSYLSEIITLDPGDIIVMGTPGGVGAGRKPPQYLISGDIVETSIEGIGTLRNECQSRQDSPAGIGQGIGTGMLAAGQT